MEKKNKNLSSKQKTVAGLSTTEDPASEQKDRPTDFLMTAADFGSKKYLKTSYKPQMRQQQHYRVKSEGGFTLTARMVNGGHTTSSFFGKHQQSLAHTSAEGATTPGLYADTGTQQKGTKGKYASEVNTPHRTQLSLGSNGLQPTATTSRSYHRLLSTNLLQMPVQTPRSRVRQSAGQSFIQPLARIVQSCRALQADSPQGKERLAELARDLEQEEHVLADSLASLEGELTQIHKDTSTEQDKQFRVLRLTNSFQQRVSKLVVSMLKDKKRVREILAEQEEANTL